MKGYKIAVYLCNGILFSDEMESSMKSPKIWINIKCLPQWNHWVIRQYHFFFEVTLLKAQLLPHDSMIIIILHSEKQYIGKKTIRGKDLFPISKRKNEKKLKRMLVTFGCLCYFVHWFSWSHFSSILASEWLNSFLFQMSVSFCLSEVTSGVIIQS